MPTQDVHALLLRGGDSGQARGVPLRQAKRQPEAGETVACVRPWRKRWPGGLAPGASDRFLT